jgi:ChrR Cupin-like domain
VALAASVIPGDFRDAISNGHRWKPSNSRMEAFKQQKDKRVMGVNKEHKEFHAVDMSAGWETPAGYPAGIQQKILSGGLDETNKRGTRSRLLRFAPGVYTTKPFVHDYWEEVYLISGDLTVGNDEKGEGGTAFAPNTYASRPPGAYHGPFKSKNGCMLFEIHYFDPV